MTGRYQWRGFDMENKSIVEIEYEAEQAAERAEVDQMIKNERLKVARSLEKLSKIMLGISNQLREVYQGDKDYENKWAELSYCGGIIMGWAVGIKEDCGEDQACAEGVDPA